MHVRSIRIKDTHHTDIDTVFAAIVGGQRLGATLALIVAATDSDGVDVPPVALDLRMTSGSP